MPEAVTTQHETLWIGVNRSAMVRVPYVVSSPEIADPVQPIDATNLASDMRVYIPGIKDYSGDLVWEANSQRYRPGELRDLLAMDGCHVWAERRMPMVGARVCIEGEASVSLSAADPDGVQRVTIRIAPSAPMAVEEWSGDTSEGYLYRIRTNDTGMNVQRVDVSYGGRPLSMVSASWTRAQGAANIPKEWAFNGGVGPFGCWYGAFNVDDYVAGSESEEPVCTEAGRLAFKLDPYDLGRTLAGTELAGTYNVMLVVPTVYWKVTGNDLLLSDRASYSSPSASASGMVAYAHTATLPGGGERTYPYIGIGVYEASSSGGVLLSASGKTPTVNLTHDQFKELADALTPAEGSYFQQWNFYQWTLFKMMAYLVMGTKNSQWAMGDGPVSGSAASVTGQADRAGPYADSTSQYDKLFIENSWGSVWNYVGDAFFKDYVLHAGRAAGGAVLGGQPEVEGAPSLPSLGGTGRWVQSASRAATAWDLPATADTSSTASDPAKTGDSVWGNASERCILIGGRWHAGASAGISYVHSLAGLSYRDSAIGSRLAYLMAADAVAPSEATGRMVAAPARSAAKDGGRAALERMVAEAQEEASKEAEEPEESKGTPEAETIEEDMR
jgi:hypothetical protein